jgi:hypothetical protein
MHTRPCAQGFDRTYPSRDDVALAALSSPSGRFAWLQSSAYVESLLAAHPMARLWNFVARALTGAVRPVELPEPPAPTRAWFAARVAQVAALPVLLRVLALVAAPAAPPALVAA